MVGYESEWQYCSVRQRHHALTVSRKLAIRGGYMTRTGKLIPRKRAEEKKNT